MSDLTAFLLARLDEDEVLALSAGPHGRPLGGHWVSRHPGAPELHMYGEFGWTVEGADVETHDSEWGKAVADHIARHDPARVLADVQTKRAIVDEAAEVIGLNEGTAVWMMASAHATRTLRHLASAYADHPDYREEWRP